VLQYFVVKGAVGSAELAAWNAQIDAANPDGDTQLGLTAPEARAMMADPHSPVGKDVQQGFGNSPGSGLGWQEPGNECFDTLIDHEGYISHVKEFVNGDLTTMTGGGSVMQRWPGQASGVHSGGLKSDLFNYDDETDSFLCRAVNVMVALNDSPENGGNTSIVPGSHKSNLPHPFQEDDAGHPQNLWYSDKHQERRHGRTVNEGGALS
jgi:hypothetical protein